MEEFPFLILVRKIKTRGASRSQSLTNNVQCGTFNPTSIKTVYTYLNHQFKVKYS